MKCLGKAYHLLGLRANITFKRLVTTSVLKLLSMFDFLSLSFITLTLIIFFLCYIIIDAKYMNEFGFKCIFIGIIFIKFYTTQTKIFKTTFSLWEVILTPHFFMHTPHLCICHVVTCALMMWYCGERIKKCGVSITSLFRFNIRQCRYRRPLLLLLDAFDQGRIHV